MKQVKTRKPRGNRPYAAWVPWAFLLPHLMVFACFNVFPILTGVFASFTKWTLGKMPVWVGWENFRNLLANDQSMYYWQLRWGLRNTVVFVLLCVPLRILIPLALALALNTRCRGHRTLQALYYLPALMSLSVVMVSWKYMFDPGVGVINNLLGIGKIQWFNAEPWNWIAIVFITAWWGTGGNMLIYQSALAGISRDVLDAAEVDGAGAWQKTVRVMIPSIRFPLQYTVITSVIAEFGIWGQPDMFNGGGPVMAMVNGFPRKSNMMMLQYIADSGFGSSGVNAGIASGMALILGLLIFAVSLIQFRVMRRNAD